MNKQRSIEMWKLQLNSTLIFSRCFFCSLTRHHSHYKKFSKHIDVLFNFCQNRSIQSFCFNSTKSKIIWIRSRIDRNFVFDCESFHWSIHFMQSNRMLINFDNIFFVIVKIFSNFNDDEKIFFNNDEFELSQQFTQFKFFFKQFKFFFKQFKIFFHSNNFYQKFFSKSRFRSIDRKNFFENHHKKTFINEIDEKKKSEWKKYFEQQWNCAHENDDFSQIDFTYKKIYMKIQIKKIVYIITRRISSIFANRENSTFKIKIVAFISKIIVNFSIEHINYNRSTRSWTNIQIVNYLNDKTKMRNFQTQIDRNAIFLKILNEKINAIYENFDRRDRFNMRILENDRFEIDVTLKNQRFAININDLITWNVVVQTEKKTLTSRKIELKKLKIFVKKWQWSMKFTLKMNFTINIFFRKFKSSFAKLTFMNSWKLLKQKDSMLMFWKQLIV